MYQMKDGILYRDGTPVFGLGISYYASFHPEKRTVPDDGDKIGEMVKDVRDIALAGFNHIRTASLGAISYADDVFMFDTSFPDAMIAEAEKNDLAVFMRLQGYSMNARGHRDGSALDQFGNPSAAAFLHDTIGNPALDRDTDEESAALATHYATFPTIIGFQIFNEPTIQAWQNDPPLFFDYNPYALSAFRAWLVEKGYYSEEGAKNLEVPREWPIPSDKKPLFRLFRQFGVEHTSAMLTRVNTAVRAATPHLPCFTNAIAVPFSTPVSGCEADVFAIGGMDMIGFDLYEEIRGEEYYHSARLLDLCENAAFLHGKTAWLPEMCCRTNMRVDDYEREAYAAVAAGFKGVTYYLWRADLGGPEVQLGGMLWNDRTKTAKFDEAVTFNRMLEREGKNIVTAARVRDGVAILYSLHGAAMGEFSDEYGENRWYNLLYSRYNELKKCGVTPIFITADKLADAPFDVKLLFVPSLAMLDKTEKALVEAFAKTHPVVLGDNRFHAACGETVCGMSTISNWCHKPAGTWQAELFNHRERFRVEELLTMTGISPLFTVRSAACGTAIGALVNRRADTPYYLLSLVYIRADGEPDKGVEIVFDEARTGTVRSVRYVDRHGEKTLVITRKADGNACVNVPDRAAVGGAFVYLYV